MKNERGHELEHNELADWLGDSVKTVKPYVNVIIGVILAVLIVIVGGTWWMQQSQAKVSESWDAFYTALATNDSADLAIMAEDFPGTKAADWARVVAGDMHLNAGCNLLFTNRADANLELDKAVVLYEQVLDESQQGVILDRATYSLARTREAMGELEEAKALYAKVTKNWADGPFAEIAANRLNELAQPATLAFYEKFEKFDPKPAFADQPGIPGAGPLFNESSLMGPDSPLDPSKMPTIDPSKIPMLDLKAMEGDTKADEPTEKPTEPAAKQAAPAKPEAKPAAAEKPADAKKPVESKTPAKK